MSRQRGLWWGFGLAAVAIGSTFAGFAAHERWLRLPDLATADEQGLVRWMVLADLAEHPVATQRQLVDRMEATFVNRGPDLSAADQLTPAQRERLQRNALLLRRVWFFARVDEFAACPPSEKNSFLDRQIAAISRWAELEQALTGGGSTAAPLDFAGWMTGFFATLDEWTLEVEAAQSERMWNLVKAGLMRWLGTYDLAGATESARRSLVQGLEKQIGGNLQLAGATEGFSAAEERLFWRNVETLAEQWFVDKALACAALPSADRPRFVAEQMKLIGQFAPFAEKLATPTTTTKSKSAAAALLERLNAWIARATPEARPAVEQFARRLQAAFLWRRVEAWFEAK